MGIRYGVGGIYLIVPPGSGRSDAAEEISSILLLQLA
jgi:hypothetical protein